MKRFPILGVLLLVPAVMLFGIVGCTKTPPSPAKPADSGKATDGDNNDGGKKKKAEEITTAQEGTIKGVVKFKGTPPTPEIDPRIEGHKEKDFCLSGPMIDKQKQLWIVGKDGALANVVIFLGPPEGKKFKKLTDEQLMAFKPVHIDQPFCNYLPHVVALYADYQPVIAKNSAKVSHNVQIQAGPQRGGTKDINLKPGDDTGSVWLKDGPEGIIPAACSIHTWMNAKIALFNQPYFAVTKEDGSFEIKNVPVDTELTVYMWHESMGELKDKATAQKITLKKGDNEVKGLEVGAK